ncbi:MAG: sigma-54-dependent transcriptional regulator [Bdellovibrionia bacterium]
MTNNRAFNLLLVDDDPLVHETIKLILPQGWKVFSVQNFQLLSIDRFYHAAFVDMHLDPKNPSKIQGTKVLSEIHEKYPQTDLVAISGDLNPELMESCLKAGAQKFLAKPFSKEELQLTLEKIQAYWDLRTWESTSQKVKWIGSSSASQNVLKKISELRGESKSILIEGETGAGKEVTAKLLHQQEPSRPFVSVNMASIPENLFESEFFGHVKGAFTGAEQNKLGLVEIANGGDLFLDEIEALSLPHQAKLLRFLESGEAKKVGGKETYQVNCRVISASNQSLAEMVKAKTFREDLYFRLRSFHLQLPPLRDRQEDIPILAQAFIDLEKPRLNKQWTPEALEELKKYSWPGNVRELKRVCEQLALTSPLPIIRANDVQSLLKPNTSNLKTNEIDLSAGLSQLVEDFERSVIIAALTQQSDVKATANLLKISLSSLYKKIDDYELKEFLQ